MGPILKNRDIPLIFPLFNSENNLYIEQFLLNKPTFEEPLSMVQIALLPALTDAAFALDRLALHSDK